MKIDNYKIVVGNATDVGKVRLYNEDYMAHFGTAHGYCVIVCDGMGGHAAGDVASRAAVDAIKHYLQDGRITKTDTPNALHNAVEKVGASVTAEPIQLLHNDKILLCSDGLTTHASETEISEIINSNEDVQLAASKLVEKANEGGGTDNITVQLIQYIGKPSPLKKFGFGRNIFYATVSFLLNLF